MNAIQQSVSPQVQQALDEQLAALAKPGVVFSEPVKEGNFTVITAAEYRMRRGKPSARPVAVIIISPNGVQVRGIPNPVRTVGIWAMALGVLLWGSAIIMHPPWRPGVNLLDEVRELIGFLRSLDREKY